VVVNNANIIHQYLVVSKHSSMAWTQLLKFIYTNNSLYFRFLWSFMCSLYASVFSYVFIGHFSSKTNDCCEGSWLFIHGRTRYIISNLITRFLEMFWNYFFFLHWPVVLYTKIMFTLLQFVFFFLYCGTILLKKLLLSTYKNSNFPVRFLFKHNATNQMLTTTPQTILLLSNCLHFTLLIKLWLFSFLAQNQTFDPLNQSRGPAPALEKKDEDR